MITPIKAFITLLVCHLDIHSTSTFLQSSPMKPLEKVIFNVHEIKGIEFPFAKGVVFKPLLHPSRQDGSGIDLKNGKPLISHSSAQFTINPGYGWPKTKFSIAEMYYITAGTGEIEIEGIVHPVKEGDTIYVPPGLSRALKNTGTLDLIYLSITDPAWSPDAEAQIQ